SGAVLTRASVYWGMGSSITRLPAFGGTSQRLTPRRHDSAQLGSGQAKSSSSGVAPMKTETQSVPERNTTPLPTGGQRSQPPALPRHDRLILRSGMALRWLSGA